MREIQHEQIQSDDLSAEATARKIMTIASKRFWDSQELQFPVLSVIAMSELSRKFRE